MSVTLQNSETAWYVIRTKPKSEHIAALHLQKFANLDEVFAPRIRFQKGTKRGKVWFVEALFPGYIFARFELAESLRAVNATTGVLGVLRFDVRYATLDESLIGELQNEFPEDETEVRELTREIQEGDEVTVVEGAMTGSESVVTKILSGKERVRILLEWLGEDREVEVSLNSLIRPGQIRSELGL
ncbi:MAG: transcription termination/antitermination NusG family protein [Verrucomicrobiota bacterium]